MLGEESHYPSAFPTWWGGAFFPGFVPPNDMIDSESVVGIKPGDSGVVCGYQVHEFTGISSAEHVYSITHIGWVHG